MRYFFHISYHGSTFNGWQKHPKAKSIQETIEVQLTKILKIPLQINGCGRTDSQVHATQYFFHVDIDKDWDFDLLFRLNMSLPSSISVLSIHKVDDKSHARFDAVQRRYNYLIHTEKNSFLAKLSSYYPVKLDVKAMGDAVSLLPKYDDYRAFCTSPNKYDHTICRVADAKLMVDSTGTRLNFQISSNRFLTRMIRIIMGKLLKIGLGEMTISEFETLLIHKETPENLDIAHPTGLYLSRVIYPYLNLQPNCHPLLEEDNWQKV